MSGLKKIIFSLALFAAIAPITTSQELNCSVQVSAQRIQGSNREVFQEMQKALYEFMNNKVWNNHIYR